MRIKICILLLMSCMLSFGQSAFTDTNALKKDFYTDSNKTSINISSENIDDIMPILYQYISAEERNKIAKLQTNIDALESKIEKANERIKAGDSVDQLKEDIKNYEGDIEDDKTDIYIIIRDSFKNSGNPFIALPNTVQSSERMVDGLFSKGFSSIGSLNVTTIADGLAKFLVQRTKEELSVAFFDKLKDTFRRYPEFKLLFPNTQENLLLIESYNFSGYLSTLRTGFLKDVENLSTTLGEFKDLNSNDCLASDGACRARMVAYQNFFKTDTGRLFNISVAFVKELQNGSNPADIISAIADNSDFKGLSNDPYTNVKNTVYLGDLISKSLLSDDANQTWVSRNEIKEVIKDRQAFRFYVGLLYQQERSNAIQFKIGDKTKSFREVLAEAKGEIDKIEKYISDIITDLNQVNLAMDNFSKLKSAGSQPDNADYFQFYNGVISFVSNASNFSSFGLQFSDDQQKKIKEYLDLARLAGNLYEDVSTKNYSSAIMNARVLFKKAFPGENKFFDELLKYGTFMGSVAEADSSDEVQQIIESIVLPAGSATIKKRTEFNIALNAYVGVSPGVERNGELDDYKFTFGISAPIGIATSWGHGKKYNRSCDCDEFGGSSTLFVSLVDLGGLTRYRFGDGDTEELPEIKLENIFAPGAYYVYGFPKSPLSIGFGGQLGPQLREITSDQMLQLDSKLSLSFKVFFAVDIPLLNFYTKSR